MSVEGARLKLRGAGLHGKNTRVWLNDVEVTKMVQSVQVEWACDGINRATIRLLVDDLDVEGVVLPERAPKEPPHASDR